MPFINVKTNATLSARKKEIIKRRLFANISVLPGKSDAYLMVAVEDGVDMAFHRDSETPMAMVNISIFGGATKDAYQRLNTAVAMILSDEAGIGGDYCYVRFEESKYWGFNGFMF